MWWDKTDAGGDENNGLKALGKATAGRNFLFLIQEVICVRALAATVTKHT